MAHYVELQIAAKTDTGRIRAQNEDAVAVSATHGIAVVADGMGGYNAGEIASGMASVIFKEILEEKLRDVQWDWRGSHTKLLRQWVIESVEHANSTIYQSATIEPEYSGMGTTLVASFFHHDKVIVAHVGDSRAYRLRRGTLEQITRDHSVLQEQIDAGLISEENARFAPNRNLVTRAVGVGLAINVETREFLTEVDDLYLLCSDGLTDMVTAEEVNQILMRDDLDLDAACRSLIDAANHNGGRDNISVILVKLTSVKPESRSLLSRLWSWFR